MNGLITGILAAAPGLLAGSAACFAVAKASRRQQVSLEHAREELLVMLSQQKTECLDGIAEVGRGVASLEQSALQTQEALQDRLTPSARSKAIQLLRSGIPADAAASTLAMPRSEVRLIAAVTRTLTAP